jgi:hypothetical protein
MVEQEHVVARVVEDVAGLQVGARGRARRQQGNSEEPGNSAVSKPGALMCRAISPSATAWL